MKILKKSLPLVLILLVCGCSPQLNLNDIQVINTPLNIGEARSWFLSNNLNEDYNRSRVGGIEKFIERKPQWQLTEELTFADGTPVLVTPLLYNNTHRVSTFRTEAKISKNSKKISKKLDVMYSQLLMYRGKSGKIYSYVMTYAGSEEYRKTNSKIKKETFSGFVVTYDITETTIVDSWEYKNGKPKQRIGAVLQAKNAKYKNARTTCVNAVYYDVWTEIDYAESEYVTKL